MTDPHKVPCDQVLARLWEYLDGELPADGEAEIRAHLDVCAHCFPQYDFERAYLTFIRRTAEQPVPPGVRRRVFETILAEDSGRPSPEPGAGACGRETPES